MARNDGRSYYDSLQVTVRKQFGDLRYALNYTFSKNLAMDNISTDGNGFTQPYDNFNLRLNKAISSADHPHNLNWFTMYSIPWGHGKRFGNSMPRVLDSITGGWDLGMVGVWQSGNPFTISSGRATGPTTSNTTINWNGARNIGGVLEQGNGVFFFTPDQIAALTNVANEPAAGSIGSSGQNTFRGPRFFNTDVSLVKHFKITEHHLITFRAEAYNVFNHPNFGNPAAVITTPSTFGKISTDFGPGGSGSSGRILQGALRYDF